MGVVVWEAVHVSWAPTARVDWGHVTPRSSPTETLLRGWFPLLATV